MARTLLKTDVSLALMMPADDGDFPPSGKQVYPYFFAVNWKLDPQLDADIHAGLMFILQRIYAAHRVIMQAREPDDSSYIAVMGETHEVIPADQYAQAPWLSSHCPIWEDTNCVEVTNDQWRKVPREEFTASLTSD